MMKSGSHLFVPTFAILDFSYILVILNFLRKIQAQMHFRDFSQKSWQKLSMIFSTRIWLPFSKANPMGAQTSSQKSYLRWESRRKITKIFSPSLGMLFDVNDIF